jgi:protein-tyrosine phosphatase
VFHCTGGKDRAGFAAALALLVAGVPRETVIQDFMRTNEYTAGYIDRNLWIVRAVSLFRTDPDRIRPLLGVERAYIEAALDTIDSRYGSLDRYLHEGLGLDDTTLASIRHNLVEN